MKRRLYRIWCLLVGCKRRHHKVKCIKRNVMWVWPCGRVIIEVAL